MHVPSSRAVDHEPDGTTHLKCGDANAATHTRTKCLRSDLSTSQQNQSVNRFKWNPLTSGEDTRSAPR